MESIRHKCKRVRIESDCCKSAACKSEGHKGGGSPAISARKKLKEMVMIRINLFDLLICPAMVAVPSARSVSVRVGRDGGEATLKTFESGLMGGYHCCLRYVSSEILTRSSRCCISGTDAMRANKLRGDQEMLNWACPCEVRVTQVSPRVERSVNDHVWQPTRIAAALSSLYKAVLETIFSVSIRRAKLSSPSVTLTLEGI